MARPFDPASSVLVKRFGGSVVRLALPPGAEVVRWNTSHPELASVQRVPDGLIETWLAGDTVPVRWLVEFYAYPKRDAVRSLADDAQLAAVLHGELPELLAVVLAPRGRLRLPASTRRASRLGNTQLRLSWRVVNLWEQDAETFLATEDPGVMPWVPLMRSARPPAEVFRACRRVIEAEAPPERVEDLLTMAVALGTIRYDRASLWDVFGRRKVMLELPIFQEIEREAIKRGEEKGHEEGRKVGQEEGRDEGIVLASRAALRDIIEERFKKVPAAVGKRIDAETDPVRLARWRKAALRAADAAALRQVMDE